MSNFVIRAASITSAKKFKNYEDGIDWDRIYNRIKQPTKPAVNLSLSDIQSRLESLGGNPTLKAAEQFLSDPDLEWIARKGKAFKDLSKKYNGPDGLCHWNVGKLYSNGLIAKIGIGFAQNSEGWHQHTWGMNRGVVETTPSNFGNSCWFGVLLNQEQAAGFAAFLTKHRPGQGMVRTKRGGPVRKMTE